MVITQTAFPSKYVQGAGAISRLPGFINQFGKKGLLIVDPFVLTNVLPSCESAFTGAEFHREKFGGECSEDEIKRLVQAGKDNGADSVIGFGGGKTLDTAKAVAFYLKAPIIIVPTIASTDAPCSARAVIYTPTGEVVRYLDLPENPNVVLVDTSITIKAPVRFIVSGMGDALSTWLEAESCMIKYAPNSTGDGTLPGSMTAYTLAKSCYDTLIQYGELAKLAAESGVVTPAYEHVVEANTLLSGLGFESGGLASCHAIHNGLSELPECHKFMHGEKVAIGCIASVFLTDKPKEKVAEVFDFCEAVGLPITLADVGIKDVTEEKLRIIAKRTCVESETIHNELCPISEDAVIAAIKTADAEGRRRKALKK